MVVEGIVLDHEEHLVTLAGVLYGRRIKDNGDKQPDVLDTVRLSVKGGNDGDVESVGRQGH